MSSLKEIQALQLQSEKVFDYFEEICAIPHGSRNTKAISDYLVAFAKKHDLTWYQDESNNVVIVQEATAGYEQADTIILQGHMDMVCEKENGCAIDFEKDGLDLYVDGDFLKARGTTLGGDDGIAVAMALAILDDQAIPHPRLEVVLTTDEEIGMLGAEAIDLSMLKGHKLLNIDSDVEGHFLTSCAGGMTVETTIPVDRMSQNGLAVTLTVTGLCGGHSGSEIDKEHANANMVSRGRPCRGSLPACPCRRSGSRAAGSASRQRGCAAGGCKIRKQIIDITQCFANIIQRFIQPRFDHIGTDNHLPGFSLRKNFC